MNPYRIVHLNDGPPANEIVVVIDVLRAFATAAAIFSGGAQQILCVEGLEQARRLHAALPGALLVGEERGGRPAGFDAGNSPPEVSALDLAGRSVVLRTTNGTRGLVAAQASLALLGMGAPNVTATAAWIQRTHPGASVSAVATGSRDEDAACARYLGALLAGADERTALEGAQQLRATVARIGAEIVSSWSAEGRGPDGSLVGAWLADVEASAQVGVHDFAMVGRPQPDPALSGDPLVVELRAVSSF